jgi:hypothetical protein
LVCLLQFIKTESNHLFFRLGGKGAVLCVSVRIGFFKTVIICPSTVPQQNIHTCKIVIDKQDEREI